MNQEKEKTKKKKIPTAKKRDLQNTKKQLANKSFKSKTKTAIKDFINSLKDKEQNSLDKLKKVFSLMDKGTKKKIYKKNKANRVKSRLHLQAQKKS